MVKIKVGDLVKYSRNGDTWFPIPREEITGVVVEIDRHRESNMVVRIHWNDTHTFSGNPPIWISESLLEVLSRG
jgi:hypothetical protein